MCLLLGISLLDLLLLLVEWGDGCYEGCIDFVIVLFEFSVVVSLVDSFVWVLCEGVV